MDVELEAHEEEQGRDADLGQKIDGLCFRDEIEHIRADDDAGGDEGDDEGLLQEQADEPQGGGQGQNHRKFIKCMRLAHRDPSKQCRREDVSPLRGTASSRTMPDIAA